MDKSIPVTNTTSVRNTSPSHKTRKKIRDISSNKKINKKKSSQTWKLVDTDPFGPVLGEDDSHSLVSSPMNMYSKIHEFKASGLCSSMAMTSRSTPVEENRELNNNEGLEL